jgi:hypothetical protein
VRLRMWAKILRIISREARALPNDEADARDLPPRARPDAAHLFFKQDGRPSRWLLTGNERAAAAPVGRRRFKRGVPQRRPSACKAGTIASTRWSRAAVRRDRLRSGALASRAARWRGWTRSPRPQRALIVGGVAALAAGGGGPARQVHPARVASLTRLSASGIPPLFAPLAWRGWRSLRPISRRLDRQRGALARGAGRR